MTWFFISILLGAPLLDGDWFWIGAALIASGCLAGLISQASKRVPYG